MRMSAKRWLVLAAVIVCFSIFLVANLGKASTLGNGNAVIVKQSVVVNNNSVSLPFNNVTVTTGATYYNVNYTASYPSGAPSSWGNACAAYHCDTNTGSWDVTQSSFSKAYNNALKQLESNFAATGQTPTTAEFQNFFNNLTLEYDGTAFSQDPNGDNSNSYTAAGQNGGSSATETSDTTNGVPWAGMLESAYNSLGASGRSYQSYSANQETPGNFTGDIAGSRNGNFHSTYTTTTFTVNSDNQVNILTGKTFNKGSEKVTETITNTRLSGNLTVSGQGTTYTLDVSVTVSPLVLNLDGTGKLEASNGEWLPHPNVLYKNRLVLFDLFHDGFPVIMEWAGPHDGILVDMSLGDCSLNNINGSCLLGNTDGFANGYEKLAVRDRSGNGKLTGDELKNLYVWQDKNGNGKADPGELTSVQDRGITEIDLSYDSKMVGTFIMNGKKHVMWDWYPNAVDVLKQR